MLKKSIFIILTLTLLSSYNVKAEDEIVATNTPNIEFNTPNCNDVNLVENIKSEIIKYYDKNPTSKPYLLRKRKLVLNSIGDFYKVGLKSFDTKQHPSLAREIVMKKINSRLGDDQMELCKTGQNNTNIYVLITNNQITTENIFDVSIFGINTKKFSDNISFEYKY